METWVVVLALPLCSPPNSAPFCAFSDSRPLMSDDFQHLQNLGCILQ